MRVLFGSILSIVILSGCASRGPSYVPLVDTKYKSRNEYAMDVRECQDYSRYRMDAASGAVGGAVAGALLGALIAPKGSRNYVAKRGAVIGGIGGALSANENQESITRRCLSGRGYNILD